MIPADPLDGYTEVMVIPEDECGDFPDDHGDWVLCSWCDGAWRPDRAEAHENGCPVAEVRELRRCILFVQDVVRDAQLAACAELPPHPAPEIAAAVRALQEQARRPHPVPMWRRTLRAISRGFAQGLFRSLSGQPLPNRDPGDDHDRG